MWQFAAAALGNQHKRDKNIGSQKRSVYNVHSNFIYNSSKVETAQMFIDRELAKQIVVYLLSGLLLLSKKRMNC